MSGSLLLENPLKTGIAFALGSVPSLPKRPPAVAVGAADGFPGRPERPLIEHPADGSYQARGALGRVFGDAPGTRAPFCGGSDEAGSCVSLWSMAP